MAVKRIVANIAAASVRDVRQFYSDLLGLDVVMDMGWIATLAAGGESAPIQMSIASEGGSGTPVPDLSIEVDDVDAVYQRAKQLAVAIEYELTEEPWGVRRFYLRDPAGKLVNVMQHLSTLKRTAPSPGSASPSLRIPFPRRGRGLWRLSEAEG